MLLVCYDLNLLATVGDSQHSQLPLTNRAGRLTITYISHCKQPYHVKRLWAGFYELIKL